MSDKGIKSKRRWIQWLGYIGSALGIAGAVAAQVAPAAQVAMPEYAVPIGVVVAALSALNSELARRSKNASDNQTAAGAPPEKVAGAHD
jgi:hypothetical protein